MCGFCLVLKDRKGSLIGESDVITLYCQPFQRICDLYLSFNTNQKPHIKSPKSGDFENKFYIGRSPDPFCSRPNIKEEKAVWLRETSRMSGSRGTCLDCMLRGVERGVQSTAER